MQGQRAQQQVWSAWRGEASRESVLITEEQFEYMTIGTLYGPQHADFWRRLCEHRQLFTESGFAVVQAALERCSSGGDFLISSIANDARRFVSSRLPSAAGHVTQLGTVLGSSCVTYCWWLCTGAVANAGVSTSLTAPAGSGQEIVLGEEDIQFPIKNPFGKSCVALRD